MNRSQFQRQSQMTPQRHVYPLKLLARLASATALSILLILSGHVFQSSLGSVSPLLSYTGYIIYLVVITTILVQDWRGFLTELRRRMPLSSDMGRNAAFLVWGWVREGTLPR